MIMRYPIEAEGPVVSAVSPWAVCLCPLYVVRIADMVPTPSDTSPAAEKSPLVVMVGVVNETPEDALTTSCGALSEIFDSALTTSSDVVISVNRIFIFQRSHFVTA